MRPGLSCGFVRRVDGGRAVVASWWQSHWPGGNFLADLVASIGRNDQAHHHPTVQGGGKFAVGRSLYRGEDDMSHGAAFDDRGDVVDEDRVGVAMILDRQYFDIAVFHSCPSTTADRRDQSWAMKSAGLRLTLPTGSAAGGGCGTGWTDGEPDCQLLCTQSDRRKSRTACWFVFERPRNFCTTALASDAGYAGDAVVAEVAAEKC